MRILFCSFFLCSGSFESFLLVSSKNVNKILISWNHMTISHWQISKEFHWMNADTCFMSSGTGWHIREEEKRLFFLLFVLLLQVILGTCWYMGSFMCEWTKWKNEEYKISSSVLGLENRRIIFDWNQGKYYRKHWNSNRSCVFNRTGGNNCLQEGWLICIEGYRQVSLWAENIHIAFRQRS